MTRLADMKAISLLLSTEDATAEIVETTLGYSIETIYNGQRVTLATTRGHIRHFQKLDTAFDMMKALGCTKIFVCTAADASMSQ